ncbi:MAG: hypothetical protein ACAI25_05410 [Planctomycetota bacterium]
MADTPTAAAAPTPSGASMAFLCGTAAFRDGFLAQGKKWAQQIQSAAGGAPHVQVGDLGRDVKTVVQTLARFSAASATTATDIAVMRKNLGGFRGHALVLLTHGLENHEPGLSKEEKEKTEGLLFFNVSPGQSNKDVVFFKMHLDFMEKQGAGVGPKASLDTILDEGDGKKFKADVRAFAPFVDAVRRSVYTQVYLAACGGGRRLARFAEGLNALTGKSVYFNEDTISFPTGGAISAEVGPIKGNAVSPLRDGKRFYNDQTVPLRSTSDGFLEGSMARVL